MRSLLDVLGWKEYVVAIIAGAGAWLWSHVRQIPAPFVMVIVLFVIVLVLFAMIFVRVYRRIPDAAGISTSKTECHTPTTAQASLPVSQASPFNPILTYGGITGAEGYVYATEFGGVGYNFTLMGIKNTQLNVETTAHGVTATMKFCHASGDSFLIRNVKWLEREPQLHLPSSVAIPMNDHKLLIFSGATLENINHFFPDAGSRKLQLGQWSVEITVKADNCGPLVIKGGLLVLSDTRFKFEPPFQAANLDT